MRDGRKVGSPLVGQVMEGMSDYPYLLVNADDSIEDVAAKVKARPGIRSIYVVDSQGRMIGALSLGRFIRVMTATRCSHRLSTRNLLSRLTADSVRELMDDHLVYATPDQRVQDVLERMLRKDIKEVPVLDQDGRIIKNIGLLELWDALDPEDRGCGCPL